MDTSSDRNALETEGEPSAALIPAAFLIAPTCLGMGLYLVPWPLLGGSLARTEGVVVRQEVTGDGSKQMHRAVVEFLVDGQHVEFVDGVGQSGGPLHPTGEPVLVLYDPDEPTEARIDSAFGLWFFPVFLVLLGTIFAVAGLGALRSRRQRQMDRASRL